MVSMSQHLSVQGWVEAEGKIAPPATRRAAGAAAGAREASLGKEGHDLLVRAVKQDVIPRLVAMPWVRVSTQLDDSAKIGDATIRRLTTLCLESDAQAVSVFVAQLHRAGVAAEAIFENLLTPVARQLGLMWEDDTCSFVDVTIGVLRLQNAQRSLTEEFLNSQNSVVGAPRAVLMPVPGEQHSFGLALVSDYFLRAGWNARLQPVPTDADAIRLVRRESFDMIGLSFACDDRIPAAQALIVAMRKASANTKIIVMVGGPAFMADPELAGRIGADATALDGAQAVLRANDLLHPPVSAP
jgi:methanogenic corrinoid protein MtbC1